MVFSSVVFLFFFLPFVFLCYFLVPFRFKNLILLLFSLLFYAWGEPTYLFLMIFSILANYLFGILIEWSTRKKTVLTFSILLNIGILCYFKYTIFFIGVLNGVLHTYATPKPISLPIGISFYTFHALSYLIDVYRKKERAQKNLFDLSLYISFFPQLVAGPIIRYNTVADQLKKRVFSSEDMAEGIRRFIIGLSKKVMLANTFGKVADDLFSTPIHDLSTASAWIGILAYTLQIYFDFSGYSDMAIGLGRMFGFHFLENFNYPYISQSISEFWRRWHISLSSWFRDYVYFPLGGSRVDAKWKVYRNLLIVWSLTGFWHGASWTFIAWGAYYGMLIILEKAGLEPVLSRLWKPIRHLYVLFIVMIGWVFFRADNFPYAFHYIQTLLGFVSVPAVDTKALYYLSADWLFFLVGLIASTPIFLKTAEFFRFLPSTLRVIAGTVFYLFLFLEVILFMVNETYNPFLYFRF